MQELENMLRLEQIAQSVVAEVAQLHTWRKCATGELLDRLGEKDLSPIPR
jgi:hypothetical protein